MDQTFHPWFLNAPWLAMQQRFWENTLNIALSPPAALDGLAGWNAAVDSMCKQLSQWIDSPFQQAHENGQAFFKFIEHFQGDTQSSSVWQAYQTSAQLWQHHQQAQQAVFHFLQKIGTRALQLLNQKLEQLGRQQPLPPHALYAVWVEAGEEAYADFVFTDECPKIIGELFNSWFAWQHHLRITLDEQLASLGLPTYAQTQHLQSKLANLRSQQADRCAELRSEIARLQGVIATLEKTVKAKPTEVVKEVVIEKIVEKNNTAEVAVLNTEIAHLQGMVSELQAKLATAETNTLKLKEEPAKKKTPRKSSIRTSASFKTR